MSDFEQRAQEIIEAGKILDQQGLVRATSGNFSAGGTSVSALSWMCYTDKL